MNDGEKLKCLRMMKGYSQKGIAKKLGVTQQAYSKLENQKKKISDARKNEILKALRCSNEEFEKLENFFTPRKKNVKDLSKKVNPNNTY